MLQHFPVFNEALAGPSSSQISSALVLVLPTMFDVKGALAKLHQRITVYFNLKRVNCMS